MYKFVETLFRSLRLHESEPNLTVAMAALLGTPCIPKEMAPAKTGANDRGKSSPRSSVIKTLSPSPGR